MWLGHDLNSLGIAAEMVSRKGGAEARLCECSEFAGFPLFVTPFPEPKGQRSAVVDAQTSKK